MNELLTRVPAKLRKRFREIVALTDKFCAAHLNNEYRDLCRACAADACEAGVPVESGKPASWAAGVIYSVTFANFMTSDPSQPFHMPGDELAKRAGVSPATMHNKAKAIRDTLDIVRFDSRYTTARLQETSPLSSAVAAFERLLATEHSLARSRSEKKKTQREKPASPPRIYTLDVSLLSGPITEAFAKKNRSVVRTIEIRGDQTLDDLHEAIFDAFDRDDPHMYEFQFGKGPMDPKGPRYVMPEAGDGFGPPIAGYTDETTIDDLELKVGRQFGYWFDFGDDWQHQIDVVSIAEGQAKGQFPRITKRVGASPPQYVDWDEE